MPSLPPSFLHLSSPPGEPAAPPPAGSPAAGADAWPHAPAPGRLRSKLERLTSLALGYGPDLPAGSFVFITAAALLYLLGLLGGRPFPRRFGLF